MRHTYTAPYKLRMHSQQGLPTSTAACCIRKCQRSVRQIGRTRGEEQKKTTQKKQKEKNKIQNSTVQLHRAALGHTSFPGWLLPAWWGLSYTEWRWWAAHPSRRPRRNSPPAPRQTGHGAAACPRWSSWSWVRREAPSSEGAETDLHEQPAKRDLRHHVRPPM